MKKTTRPPKADADALPVAVRPGDNAERALADNIAQGPQQVNNGIEHRPGGIKTCQPGELETTGPATQGICPPGDLNQAAALSLRACDAAVTPAKRTIGGKSP